MKYIYFCSAGHHVEASEYGQEIECPYHFNTLTRRDLSAELVSQYVRCDDHIRRSYNGARIDHALAEQGRPLDPLAPRDKFEAKHVEAATGRQYIGADISGLSAKAQKAILNGGRRPGEDRPL